MAKAEWPSVPSATTRSASTNESLVRAVGFRSTLLHIHTRQEMTMSKVTVNLMVAAVLATCAFGGLALRPARSAPPSHAKAPTVTDRLVVDFETRSIVFGESTLIRTDHGVTMHFTASDLPAGVYTAWMPIFEPGGTVPVVAGRVGGHVVGNGGELTFAVHLKEGEIISGHPVFPSGALLDARGEDIGMVVRYHGPVDPGWIYEQTHTFEPGVAVDALFTRHNAP
jgi:hypothetical protein